MTDAVSSAVDEQVFRTAMRAMASTVALIAVGVEGKRTGCTVSSLQPYALDPPTVLVCLNREGATASALTAAGRFGASVLAAGQAGLARAFTGFDGRHGEARFGNGAWTTLMHEDTPVLADGLIAMDCAVALVVPHCSHIAVFGRILALRSRNGTPLTYWQGQYTGPQGEDPAAPSLPARAP